LTAAPPSCTLTGMFRIGNGAGFSGDRIDAPGPVVDTLIARGGPAAMFFEVLGERTVALAQLEKRRDPARGYEPMLERLLEPILEKCARHGIAVIGNFGAANPAGAARAIARLAEGLGLGGLRIGVVEGDDLSASIDLAELEVHEADAQLDHGGGAMVSANAYLSAQPIVEALRSGAQIVVTGRCGDPSLALAPLIHHYGWTADDWTSLALGSAVGHLLECGSQVTGGVYYDPGYKDIPDPANIGFPIAEVSADGRIVITKADATGGVVNLQVVKEQLLYEVHDPANYITPDVTLDFSGVSLRQDGADRVEVLGVRGKPAPEKLKVTVCFEGGWLGEGEISVAGPNCFARAKSIAEVLLERLRRRKLEVRSRVDLIGIASVHDDDSGTLWRAYTGRDPTDIRVRLAVAGNAHDDVDQAAREVLALLCCGPAGSGGARWRTTQRIRTQSYLVPRASVEPRVSVKPAGAWL
jgi:Acyclic terpene utilisation family protein AtuA